jgi:hypothetical protein
MSIQQPTDSLKKLKSEAHTFTEIIQYFEEYSSREDYMYDQANEPFDEMSRGQLLNLIEFVNKIAQL